jgi:hypothetical protein
MAQPPGSPRGVAASSLRFLVLGVMLFLSFSGTEMSKSPDGYFYRELFALEAYHYRSI